MKWFVLVTLLVVPAVVYGQQFAPLPSGDQMDFPAEQRVWFRNPDGSCVQCSIGMSAVWQGNCPQAATLLWDTPFGKAVRGGSGPGRVEDYADRRKIPVYNVTGDAVWDYMKWAVRNGRMCAIGAGRSHFQTLVWYNPGKGTWYVCNNNSPSRIDEYNEREFRNLHLASGEWAVIIKTPAPPPLPVYVKWW